MITSICNVVAMCRRFINSRLVLCFPAFVTKVIRVRRPIFGIASGRHEYAACIHFYPSRPCPFFIRIVIRRCFPDATNWIDNIHNLLDTIKACAYFLVYLCFRGIRCTNIIPVTILSSLSSCTSYIDIPCAGSTDTIFCWIITKVYCFSVDRFFNSI